ncbi:MAG TPA: CBS domain-containing protein [Longimicrobiales bacterium]|nr:CBS domain-containing protein [Longimicrobiales bacterium]
MKLLDLLQSEHIVVPLHASGVRDAIQQLIRKLQDTGAVGPSDALMERVREDPMRDLVAVNRDVLLPHYRSSAVPALTMAMGIAPDRIPARGAGAEPGLDIAPRVLALVLAPQEAATLYLQATSTLARLLRQPGMVDRLAAQPDAESVLAIPELQEMRVQPSLTVRDVMAHRVQTVPPDTTLRSTLDLMLRRRLHAVPVVGRKGEVLGMVTAADLMRVLLPHIPRAGAEDEEAETVRDAEDGLGARPVKEIMTRSVLCVSEELGVSEAAAMMINKDVEQIPVVREGAITGMVTRADIIRKLFGTA